MSAVLLFAALVAIPPAPTVGVELERDLTTLPVRPAGESAGLEMQRVEYYAKTPDFLLFLTDRDPVLVLNAGMLRMRLLGGSPKPALATGLPANDGDVRFIKIDPASPTAEESSYTEVRYREVYPGIDLVFRSNGDYVQHDFIVAPGADPSRIRLRFVGGDQVHINQDGALVMRVGASEFTLSLPVVYQKSPYGPTDVDARYHLTRDGQVRFELGPYDHTRTLVID